MVTSTLLNPVKLDILRQLRESAGLTQSQAARLCGLTSKQGRISLGAWEQGKRIPHATRRSQIIGYLWDHLGLRKDPVQFEAVWSIFVEEWGWEPIGDREWDRFTHVERSTTIQQSSRKGVEPVNDCGEKPISPFQAPATVPHFVGRQEELTLASDCLQAEDGPPIVAIVGMGGIGKTTLAIHAAHALRSHFADGVLWASAAITNPLDIAQSWATAYGYDFSGLSDLESRAAAIRNVLNEKHALIIFDDVIDASTVRPLLPSSNENGNACRVLITTRNHDIASTLNAHPIAPPELATQAGVELLTRVLGAPRVEHEFAAAERICQIVEGLPLAVEIVAQRLLSRPQQSLENMVTRLEDSSQRLGLEISDRAIRAAFEVSWGQLNDEQKEVFSQMGVFEGRSFAIPALAYIGERSEHDTEDLVWELQALSLVGSDGNGRYRQHPLLADFAVEALGSEDDPYLKISAYYLTFIKLHHEDSSALKLEWDAIMSGMEFAFRRKMWESVVSYATLLAEPWFNQGEYERAKQGYKWAIEVARQTKSAEFLSQFLAELGFICAEQGDHTQAEPLLIESLRTAKAYENQLIESKALFSLARISIDQAEYEDAHEFLLQCQLIRQENGDLVGQAEVFQLIGLLSFRNGDFETAKNDCNCGLKLLDQDEDLATRINIMRLLFDVAFQQKENELAERYAQENTRLAQELNRATEIAETEYSMAMLNRRLKRYKIAVENLETSFQIFNKLGNQAFLAAVVYERGIIHKYLGNYQAAIQDLEYALQIAKIQKEYFNEVIGLLDLGKLYAEVKDHIKAQSVFIEGRNLANQIQHPQIASFDAELSLLQIETAA